MKQIKIVLIMMILTGLCSCRKNLLDQVSPSLLSEDQVMSNTGAVTAYMATLYTDIPMEDFSFVKGQFWTFPDGADQYTANWSDEANNSNDSQASKINGYNLAALYKAVRNVNTFLQLITTKAPTITADEKAVFIAEAKFIRAYYYFGMVKYWGGVPLLLTPPASTAPLAPNKEVEVWDQVKKDLEEAAAGLPASTTQLGYGRANKWAALALEARAMLHAASVGKWGNISDPTLIATTNGLNGVDAAHADVYMNAAYTAAKTVIEQGPYQLYSKYAAPGLATTADQEANYAKNFQYLFYDTKQGDSNTEAIFNRGYDFATSGGRTHSEDLVQLPYAVRSAVAGYSNALQPSLDLVEKFEYLDADPDGGLFGKYAKGNPPRNLLQPNQYHYDSQAAPFEHKDPRYHGTIVSNGTSFRGAIITGQRGVILGGSIIPAPSQGFAQFFNIATKTFSVNPPAGGTLGTTYVVGAGNSDISNAPYWKKKWIDPVTDISLIRDYTSRTSWLDLRLGETLLIYAEASFELGKPTAEALGAINQLRRRAGIYEYASITRERIRHERMVELAFENKTWWDYVRWRSLGSDSPVEYPKNAFNNRAQYALECYWNIDLKDWTYIRVQVRTRNVDRKSYYSDFLPADISANPALRPSGHNPYY